jgi:hypothetical protein
MAKPNPLTQGLEKRLQPAPPSTIAPSRAGRVLIGAHFSPAVQTALKIIAAEERTTIQALVAEGLNTVFAKRHKPEIAESTTSLAVYK